MQHEPDRPGGSGSGKFALSPTTPSAGGHIDLKEFPSQMDYPPGLGRDSRGAFAGEQEADGGRGSAGLGKSLGFSGGAGSGRSRISSLMFPKMRRRPFQCKYCTFSCPSATNLSIHMRIHTGEKPYKCGTCAYASARKQNLFRHMATVHKVEQVSMGGPSSAHCPFPLRVQAGGLAEDRMPVVESVYGNVQDMMLIDGDPVKIIGREQGGFVAPPPEAAATSSSAANSPHLYPCETQAAAGLQEDVVEIVPGGNPTSEYSTRHYADGSRFIFAVSAASMAPSAASGTGLPQVSPLEPFEAQKEVLQVEELPSPPPPEEPAGSGRLESPIHAYKEPITGALKRKQGRAASHTTLKNILESPLMFPGKGASQHAAAARSRPEKPGTEIKIIQSEEDLEEVLEGRQRTGIRPTPTGLAKRQDLSPSPRSLNGSSSSSASAVAAESAVAFAYAREGPSDGFFPETRPKVGSKEAAPPIANAIQSSQTSMFRHKHTVAASKLTPARKAPEQKAGNFQSEDGGRAAQMSKRAATAGASGGRSVVKQATAETRTQLSPRNHGYLVVDASDRDRRAEASPRVFDQSALKEKHRPSVGYDYGSDRKTPDRPRQDPFLTCGKASLTVQVDLNKVMCCAARKWLRTHLLECDVCEINGPAAVEQERFYHCGGPNSGDRGSGGPVEESLLPSGIGRRKNTGEDPSFLGERQLYSPHRRPQRASECSTTRDGLLSNSDEALPRRQQQQQEVMTIDVEDEASQSDATGRDEEDPIQRRSHQLQGPPHPSGGGSKWQPGATRDGEAKELGNRGASSDPGRRSQAVHAKTSAAGSAPHLSSHPMLQSPARRPDQPRGGPDCLASYLDPGPGRATKAGIRKWARKCDICRKPCHSKAQLAAHRRLHVETSQLFRCTLCRYCTLHYKLLRRHIADKHTSAAAARSATTTTTTQCTLCGKGLRVDRVATHMLAVHGIGAHSGCSSGKRVAASDEDGRNDEPSAETSGETACCPDNQNQVTEEEPPQQQDAVAMETEKASLDSKGEGSVDGDDAHAVAMTIKEEPSQED